MKVLLTGAGGQLGLELSGTLPRAGHEVVSLTKDRLDISDAGAVDQALKAHRPDLVINAAAYTNVDGCETERELSYAVNALGPGNLAAACERLGAKILHVSTNYVFDGGSERPYEPFDPAAPISAYGRGKLAGERLVSGLSTRWYIVRSAGVYGRGHNFVRTMLRVGTEIDSLNVKSDEYVSPTCARDLAHEITALVGREKEGENRRYGVYHLTNSGSCSWFEFARTIFALSKTDVEVNPVPTSDYPLPAPRPKNGLLSSLGSPKLRPWQEALEDYLEREGDLEKAR